MLKDMSKIKLKDGYKSFFDENKKMLHIYPVEKRSHFFDNCWCSPVIDNKKNTISHNFLGYENEIEFCNK